MKNVEIKGIIPPIITPMNDDESINTAELRNQVNRLIDGGVHLSLIHICNLSGERAWRRDFSLSDHAETVLSDAFADQLSDYYYEEQRTYRNGIA